MTRAFPYDYSPVSGASPPQRFRRCPLTRPCDTDPRQTTCQGASGAPSRGEIRPEPQGTTFVVGDSTRCGQARSPEETREPSRNCANIGNELTATEPYRACSESCGTHASEPLPKLTRGVGRFWRIRGSPLRKGLCARVPTHDASARNWLFCKIQSKAMVCFESQRGVHRVTDF